MTRFAALILTALASALPAAVPDQPLAQSLMGWPLTPSARAQLTEALAAHPGCDLLYLPLLKAREVQAFKDYFVKAGTDSWVLLYLLRERETFGPELEAARRDPMKVLERLFWANNLPPREGLCPWPGPVPKVRFEGYTDEITEECYSLTLTYRMDGEAGNLSLDWCAPMEKDARLKEANRLFKKAGIPLVHRNIVQQRNIDELKLPPPAKTPPESGEPEEKNIKD